MVADLIPKLFLALILLAGVLSLLFGCGGDDQAIEDEIQAQIAAAKGNNKVPLLVTYNRNPETNIDHYKIYRSFENPCGALAVVGQLSGVKFVDTAPKNKRHGCWEVTAVNTAGMESDHSQRFELSW